MTKRIPLIKLVFLLSISVLFVGCEKEGNTDTDPDVPAEPKAKISLLAGDKQQGLYGDFLANELEFKIDVPEGKRIGQYYVQFAMVQGNGMIENNFNGNPITISPDGTLKTRWQLGCNSQAQKLKAYVYRYAPYLPNEAETVVLEDSVEVYASGTKPAGWGRSCGLGWLDIFNTQVITYDNKTLYLASGALFSSTDGGMNWAKVPGVPNWNDVKGAQFNSKGWMYVLTKDQGVFYSKDLKTWQAINNGFLDMRDPTGFLVKDDVMMVSFEFDGPYLTQDNGGFWQKLLVSNNSQRFKLFNQHSDGSLYLFDDWGTFFRSKDMGKTWQTLRLDYGYYLSQPSGFAISPDGTLYVGSDDATIAEVSSVTLKGTAKRYYESNSWSQSVSHIKIFNNDVFFLVNSTPKPGIYSKRNNWGRIELDFNERIYSYFIKPDGGFLLLGENAMYYRN